MNHSAPSGPDVIAEKSSFGLLFSFTNSVSVPEGVIRPTLALPGSVNHKLRSGPTVMPDGSPTAVCKGNSVITPAGVIRPILFPVVSVNQRFPSGPATITVGLDCAVGVGKGGVKENARTLGTISRSTTKITATAVARVVRCGASFQLAAPWRPRRSGPPLVIVTYASKCFSFSAPVASLRVGNRNRPSLRL